jgi:hypothetical protein
MFPFGNLRSHFATSRLKCYRAGTYANRLAIPSASVSNSSSAVFCANMQSPETNPPCGKKQIPPTRLPLASSSVMFICRPCRMR